ncbi:MAG TPA: hypothetical protein VNS46_08625 [Nocardioides sp.]|nr:hypothetical protein [Nocardioides sp.]
MTEPTDPDAPLDAPLDPRLDARLDAGREAAVRRTLAAAGGPEPMPEAVAARLDGVIDDLVAERTASGATVSHPENPGIVVPLDAAARRRRVRVRVLLGAAAAVVAVAAGAGIVNDTDRDGDASTASADDLPARDDAGALAEGDTAKSDASEETSGGTVQDAASAAPEVASPLPRRVVSDQPLREVSADRLRESLVALQHVSLPHPAEADYSVATLSAPADFMCEAADFGTGYLVGVQYDGKPAVVAFREPVGSNQAAEVLACGTGDVLHSTILAAR